jgi:hypothetical protein
MSQAINEKVIRWSELRLPHPTNAGQLESWTIDGPFAVRKYYRVDGTDAVVEVAHIDKRNADGTLSGCLFCGSTHLVRSADIPWRPIAIVGASALALAAIAVFALGLPWWVGLAPVAAAAYPMWFLWAAGPRIETCTNCKSEFVNFCHGPRP